MHRTPPRFALALAAAAALLLVACTEIRPRAQTADADLSVDSAEPDGASDADASHDSTDLAAADLPEAPAVREVAIAIELGEPIATIPERFLAVAVDSSQLVGGYFWTPDGGATNGGLGEERVEPYDFDDAKIRNLARELAPAVLRLGGSEADTLYYDVDTETPVAEAPEGYRWVLDRATWDRAARFARELDFEIYFTLNVGPGPRLAEGGWDPQNARELMTYAVGQGDPVTVWELGNELNGMAVIHDGWSLEPAEYAADLAAARALVDELAPDAKLAGPSVAFWPEIGEGIPFIAEFMPLGGALLDIVSWHYYPQQSERCPVQVVAARPETMTRPSRLDEVAVWAETVEALAASHAPQAELWLGETGNAQCGGQPGVSDRFVGGIWWLDQLGQMAARGQQGVVRQTLSGSDYGLLDDVTLDPRPDYFNSVLWRRLMGTRVLATTSDDTRLRAYAHCRRGAEATALVLLVLNLDRESAARIDLGALGATTRRAWHLSAEALDSPTLLLNGEAVNASDDGAIGPLEPEEEDASAPLVVAPHGYAFVELDVAAAACR